MRAPKGSGVVFEKVSIGELLPGVIDNVEYDQNHKFTFQGEDKIAAAVRLVFKLDGYKFPHRTRWMKFNVGEKANLYKLILSKLVEGAKPDMDFDIDHLKGMKIKTLWAENGDFQNLESIFPLEKKLPYTVDDVPMLEEDQSWPLVEEEPKE
uniref:Uncharacterized protein n=1 Tax=viral metagenome TaxID=1070528 RepID=A0A6M3IV98_9ZZZZ